MSLDVIGAGFGRTGTLSLKLALEQLGFAPCYHMLEVFAHPEHAQIWDDAVRGKPVDWRNFLAGYRAAVDWPICHFWQELAAAFPGARFVLTERDPEAWYKSMSQTIFQVTAHVPEYSDDSVRGPQARMAHHLVEEKTFSGRTDRDHAIAVYDAHNEAVKQGLGDRVLVYDVAQGWAPLCKFLGITEPDTQFPRTNTAEDFRSRLTQMGEPSR